MSNFLIILWLIWEIKYILFWLYLWQLKEYHIGRFIDHFQTKKGKDLIFNPEQGIKLVLLIALIFNATDFKYIIFAIFVVYLFQFAVFVRNMFYKSVKIPKFTSKMILLAIVSFSIVVSFAIMMVLLNNMTLVSVLLLFDILTILIVSTIVLAIQPFIILHRNSILEEAKNKLTKIKSTSGLKVIAITGSYGKTSTKEFLTTILSSKYNILQTKEHQNSEIGIANTILKSLDENHNFFIAEIGAYNKGKIKEVCSMISPDIGIVTGVNEQHLALFGSLENLLSAEGGGELADALLPKGTLVVNGENKHCLNLFKKFNGEKLIYALSNKLINADIWADSIDVYKDHISFIAINNEKEASPFSIKILGEHNIQNILGAILVAKKLGMNMDEIAEACDHIKPQLSGMTLKNGKHGMHIIDSSYSSNPDGVLADLEYLSIFPNKKVIVMPCLIELGEKSAKIHENIGKKIGKTCDLAIITTMDHFKEIERGFIEAQNCTNILRRSDRNVVKCLLCDKPQDIYSLITLSCKADDAVLLEGRVPKQLINLLANNE